MGLNVQKGTITAPGSTGTQTYNLPSNFDPKILFLWMTYQTADGNQAPTSPGGSNFCMGMGTKDGGAVQQFYTYLFALGSQSTAEQVVHGQGTASILTGSNANSTTADWEVDLADMVTGASSNFQLAWNDLPGTSSILVHYLVLGGDAISAARVGTWASTVGGANEDVTVVAGFGQPDGLFFLAEPWTAANLATLDGAFSFGVANSDTDRRTSHIHYEDGSATMALASWQKAKALVTTGAGVTADAEMDLDAKASWPTDGFRTNWTDTPGFAYTPIGFLAWKGAMKVTIGSASVPTGSPNQAQTLTGTSGYTARGGLFWSTMIPTNAGIATATTGLGGFMVGATDGTNEGAAACSELDGDGASQVGQAFTQTKAMRHIISVTGGAAPTTKAECDSSLSGTDISLTWTTTDGSVSREFNYVIFGEQVAAAPGPVFPRRAHPGVVNLVRR